MKKQAILLSAALLCMAVLGGCKSEEQIAETVRPRRRPVAAK